eukprot:2978560-Rhodomonas_salina.1
MGLKDDDRYHIGGNGGALCCRDDLAQAAHRDNCHVRPTTLDPRCSHLLRTMDTVVPQDLTQISFPQVHATCENTDGSFTCACNAGYNGTGHGSVSSCIDVDECGTTDNCDANAECANTIGSFTCTCGGSGSEPLHFVDSGVGNDAGKGTSCREDVCISGNHTCSADSRCIMTPSGFECHVKGNLARLCRPQDNSTLPPVPCPTKSSNRDSSMAAKLVDGQVMPVSQCLAVKNEKDSMVPNWVRVDLGESRLVQWINFWVRPAMGNAQWGSTTFIEVGDIDNFGSNPTCYDHGGAYLSADSVQASCNAVGRYVFFGSSEMTLRICEAEVYGVAETPWDCSQGSFWD